MDAPYNRNGGLTLVPMPGFVEFAKRVREYIGYIDDKPGHIDTPVDIVCPEFDLHPSGEPDIAIGKDHIGGHDCYVITSGPGTYEMLGQLMLALRCLKGRHAGRITVVSAYFPLARSDKDEGDKRFALPPIIFHMIEDSCGGESRFNRIITVDLHSPQVVMAGDTGRITEISLVRRLLHLAVAEAKKTGPVCLCFPDDTASKRTQKAVASVEHELGIELPRVFGHKRRASSRSSTLQRLIGEEEELARVAGSTVLAIDDEIATGKTTIDSAKAIKELYDASHVWNVATHGIFCGPAISRFMEPNCPVDRTFVTNSIPTETRPELKPFIDSGRLEIIDWGKDLAWTVYRDHWGKSIRELR